ncbi:hypothetical protein D3C72_983820 [compost metagenome]
MVTLAQALAHLFSLGQRAGLDGHARVLQHAAEAAGVAGRHEGDGLARGAGAAGAAHAVDVGLRVLGHAQVEDVADALHVDAAGGDVGRDQHLDGAAAEVVQRAGALRLGQIAVQVGGLEAFLVDAVGELLGLRLGVAEHDRQVRLLGVQDVDQGVEAVLAEDLVGHVLDGRRGGQAAADGERVGVAQGLLGEDAHLGRHGRGEQQGLTVLVDGVQDLVQLVGEAHVEHLVGLVQHQRAALGQVDRAAVDVVAQAAGGRHHQARAAVQGAVLVTVRAAAVQGGDLHAEGARQARQGARDLQGQLAGRQHDQRLDGARGALDALQDRQAEGQRLAGAGARLDQQVTAGEHQREGLLLNGGGVDETLRSKTVQELLAELPLGERNSIQLSLLNRGDGGVSPTRAIDPSRVAIRI